MSTIGANPASLLSAQIANEQRNTLQDRTSFQQPAERSLETRDTVQRGGTTRPDTREAVTGVPDSLDSNIAAARAQGEEQSSGATPRRGQFVNILT